MCTASLSIFINNEEYILLQNNLIGASLLYDYTDLLNDVILLKKTDYDNIKTSAIPLSNLLTTSVCPILTSNVPKTLLEKDKTNTIERKTNNVIPNISENSNLQENDVHQKIMSLQPSKHNSLATKLFSIEEHTTDCMKPNRPAAFAIKQLTNNHYLLFYRKSVYDHGIDTSFRRFLSQQPGNLVAYKYFCNIANLRLEFTKHQLRLRHNGKNELSHHQVIEILKTFSVLKYL